MMVGVAQLVERFAVAEVVGSSNLLAHPFALDKLFFFAIMVMLSF